MAPKRKYTKKSGYGLKKKYGKKAVPASTVLQAAVRRQIVAYTKKQLETKQSNYSTTDGTEIAHNTFVVCDTNLFDTSQGTGDPTTSSSSNRIGDQITLKGVKIKMMVELNERYSDVTFRLLIIKKAKGDTLNTSTLFNGLSGNKMLDTINKERFTVVAQKFFKITAPNNGRRGGAALSLNGSGIDGGTDTGAFVTENAFLLSRATRLIKLWIPAKKIFKNTVVQYENGSNQPKFFDYQVLLYAYSNYSTTETPAWNVGRLNDYIRQIYYTDA